MTTLAQYTFPVGSPLPGSVVRAYATGRYLNNTGFSKNVNLMCAINTTTLTSLTIPFATNAGASGWEMRAHFYFSEQVIQTGVQTVIGCTLHADFTNHGTIFNRTGSYVALAPMQLRSTPYINVDPTQTNLLTMQFNIGGPDTLETGCAYMEAL